MDDARRDRSGYGNIKLEWTTEGKNMSFQLIYGRAGSGKSEFCLNQIREKLRSQPDGNPLILLVPEQATFLAEYALVRTPGLAGTIRAQALSFRRLAFRVLQETGEAARIPIDENGKAMLLYKLVHRHADRLGVYARSGEQFGLIDRINELFTEFRRYRITADRLDRLAEQQWPESGLLRSKLADLKLLYRDYEEELSRLYIDPEEGLRRMAEQLSRSSFVAGAEIWVDGFHGFTPQEYKVLRELMRFARKLTVTLCLDRKYETGDRPFDLDLFYPTAVTSIRLHQIAFESGADIEPAIRLEPDPLPRFRACPALAHLERAYEQRIPWADEESREIQAEVGRSGPEPIALRPASSRRAEVEAAARDMIRLVRDFGYRWRDFAVLVRNMADYEHLFETVFADYEIPFFLDGKKSALHHPLVEFIRSALETVDGGWTYDPLFRCVKTGLLVPDYGDRWQDALDLLENYVLAAGIQGKRWLDEQDWNRRSLIFAPLEDTDGNGGESGPEDPRMQVIRSARDAVIRPLRRLERRMRSAANVREMAEALYLLLEEVGAPRTLERWSSECAYRGLTEKAREHEQVWSAALHVLDQIVELMGDERLQLSTFAGVVETGLAGMKLSQVPPALDQVLIGSMERTRPGGIRCSYILGAGDGVIPARPPEDGVLTEEEREELARCGLELAPGARRKLLDEQFLIYQALSAASERLWISYPLADEEGKTLLPSEVIRHLKKMFPRLQERQVDEQPSSAAPPDEQWEYVAHPTRTFSYVITKMREWANGETVSGFWREVLEWYGRSPAWQDKLRLLSRSLSYTNREHALSPETSRKLYGELLRASVSRMERYAACPFSHFAAYGLGLRERTVYRLEAPDIGQLFHAALSRISHRLMQNGATWRELSPDQCLALAKETVEQLAGRLKGEILFSSKRYRHVARKLEQIIGRTSIVLSEQAKRGEFVPVGLELPFGPDAPIPPIRFQLPNGCTMELAGRIDRIDAAEGSDGRLYLRVIDYKSSLTALQPEEIYYGLALQMLTYLDVAVTHAERWLGRPALPAGALYFHVHNPLLLTSGAISPEQADAERFKRFKMRGIVLADEEVVQMMDRTLSSGHSQIIPVALKKDGSFYSSSSVMTLEDWNGLRSMLHRTVRSIGTNITEGNVSIRPYRIGQTSACRYCPYKPVCQFDPELEGNEFRHLAKIDREMLWNAVAAEGEQA
jgi:ATP-dependent helicase/nuclease subunit B